MQKMKRYCHLQSIFSRCQTTHLGAFIKTCSQNEQNIILFLDYCIISPSLNNHFFFSFTNTPTWIKSPVSLHHFQYFFGSSCLLGFFSSKAFNSPAVTTSQPLGPTFFIFQIKQLQRPQEPIIEIFH